MTVEIETGIISGKFPIRALHHVLEWCEIHNKELLINWNLARERKPLNTVQPLE